MRHRLEYALLWPVLRMLQWLPRPLARGAGEAIAMVFYFAHPRLRRVGIKNLQLAFPQKTARQRRKILRAFYIHLGRQLAEFCRLPRYTRATISEIIVYEGLENFEAAQARGKGVLFLTAHLGGWELSSFMHSLHGHAMNIVARPLDNPFVDRLVTRIRALHGNKIFDKDDYARGLLGALRNGETVGILMDTNMTPPQGIFADFFGVPACTAGGLARVAAHTGAAVLPGFAVWDRRLGKYRLVMGKPLELVRSHDTEADVLANTAMFNRVLEETIRQYPEQWLWIHRRWKTRPAGGPSIY